MTLRKTEEIAVALSKLPGDKSKELMALRDKYVARGPYNVTPIFVEEAKGPLLRMWMVTASLILLEQLEYRMWAIVLSNW